MLSILTMALLSAPAAAADHQLDFELGSQVSGADGWDLFSNTGVLRTAGLRVGLGLSQHLSVLASYQRGTTGADVYYDEWTDTGGPGDGFVAAYFSNTLAAGPKLSTQLNRWLSPYGLLLVTGQYATARLDADPVIDDDATQLSATGFAPGGVLAAGLDIALPFKERAWTPATFVELGYGQTLSIKLDDLGELSFSGVYSRWGLGLRF